MGSGAFFDLTTFNADIALPFHAFIFSRPRGSWAVKGRGRLRGGGQTRRPAQAHEKRERLYRAVLALRQDGLSYNEVIRKIEEEHGATLRESHISCWVNSKHHPFGCIALFEAKPCPELAYVMGVKWGDASPSTNRKCNHTIKLRVTDRDFADEFSRCLSAMLHRSAPRVCWSDGAGHRHTQASSVLPPDLLCGEVERQASVIQHCADCVGAFLEGSSTRKDLSTYGS